MMDPTKHAEYRAQRADHAAALDRLFVQYPPDVKAFMRARFDLSMYPLGFAETFAAALHAFRPGAAIGGLQDKKAEEWILELLKANGGDHDIRGAWLLDHEEDIVHMHRALAALRDERDEAMKVLAPNIPESGLVDACRQVKQVAISEADNAKVATRRLAALQDGITKVAEEMTDELQPDLTMQKIHFSQLSGWAHRLRALLPGSGTTNDEKT